MARLFKPLFGGLLAFFGILFGGLWSSVLSAFQGSEATPPASVVSAEAKPVVAPFVGEYIPNQISAPRPNRRPGKALTNYLAIAQEVSSARRIG